MVAYLYYFVSTLQDCDGVLMGSNRCYSLAGQASLATYEVRPVVWKKYVWQSLPIF